jgi:hypothetical protein
MNVYLTTEEIDMLICACQHKHAEFFSIDRPRSNQYADFLRKLRIAAHHSQQKADALTQSAAYYNEAAKKIAASFLRDENY